MDYEKQINLIRSFRKKRNEAARKNFMDFVIY